MSDDAEPQFTSLKERIAALKLQQDAPPIAPGLKSKPVPAARPESVPAAKPRPALAPKPTVMQKPGSAAASKPTPPAKPAPPAQRPPPAGAKPAVALKPAPATEESMAADVPMEAAATPTPRKRWPPVGSKSTESPEVATESAGPARSIPADTNGTRPAPAPRKRWPPVQSNGTTSPESKAEAEESPDLPAETTAVGPTPRRRWPPVGSVLEASAEPPAPEVDATVAEPARPPLPQRRSTLGSTAPSLPPRKDAPPLPKRQLGQSSDAQSPPLAPARRLPPPAPASVSAPPTSPPPEKCAPRNKAPPLPSAPRPPIPTAPRPALRREPEPKPEEEGEKPQPKPRFMVPLPSGGLEKPPPAPATPRPNGSALSNGAPPPLGAKPGPPPVPLSSRPPPVPTASRPKPTARGPASGGYAYSPSNPHIAPGAQSCLVCRDFSGPDAVAAAHPTSTIPGPHRIPLLAEALCAPFPSLTDKARAVFAWLHHNVVYDTANFFAGTVPRGLGPEDTISRGAAVCEGFADLFAALCTAAGLEVRTVSGYGKGFGFSPTDAGASADSNHAWNAVRLEGGWKLVDSCWGAGHIAPDRSWVAQFNPSMFTMSNERFGRRHFPAHAADWYGPAREWDAFLWDGEGGPKRYSAADDVGLGPDAEPATEAVRRGQACTFRASYACPHWTRRADYTPRLVFLRAGQDIVRVRDDGTDIVGELAGSQVHGGEITLSVIDTVNGAPAGAMTWAQFDAMRAKSYTMQHLFGWQVE